MKIVAIGDSITKGYPFSDKESWVEHLAREFKYEVLNKGICGDFTKGMRKRFQRDVIACTPTHAIILGGANDAFKQVQLDSVSSNFMAMVEMCRESGIIPILCLPTPALIPEQEHFMIEYRDWLKGYASKQGITVIDFYSPFLERIRADQAIKLFHDGIHPSIAGYVLMGEVAVLGLKRL